MAASSTSIPLAVLTTALLAAACGGEEPVARDPSSVSTPVPEPSVPTPAPTTETAPPSPTPPVPPAATSPRMTPPASTGTPKPTGARPECTGTTTDALQAALLKRARDARHCYVAYLTNNPGARVSLNVEARVFLNGTVGNVQAVATPPAATLSECVVKDFEKGGFPVPGGNSCVDARVPIDFDPKL